ncbi:hypothetical protein DITRI_Ditri07aG0008400 [Diplodiscus trichospermus]
MKYHPKYKSVAAVGKAGGEKWKSMSEAAGKQKAEYEKNTKAYNKRQIWNTAGQESFLQNPLPAILQACQSVPLIKKLMPNSAINYKDEPMSTSESSEEANIVTQIKTPEDHAISGSFETLEYSSSSVKTKSFFNKDSQISTVPIYSSGSDDKKKRVITRVV